MQHQQISQEMQECITNCLNCHAICLETIGYCLRQGGDHAEAAHLRLMQDCVQICMASADFMLRMSDFHQRICRICAEICDACAKDCEKFTGDEMMQRCAEACRRCAESCRKMSASMSASA